MPTYTNICQKKLHPEQKSTLKELPIETILIDLKVPKDFCEDSLDLLKMISNY